MTPTNKYRRPYSDRDLASIRDWYSALQSDAPVSAGELTLIPIRSAHLGFYFPYRTLAEAVRLGEAVISEKAQANVPHLLLLNKGSQPVFVLDGEEVVGGWQNRIIVMSILVPAGCTFEIPVTCVEQGRWHGTTSRFGCGETAHPSMRGVNSQQVREQYRHAVRPSGNQTAVWQEVACMQESLGIHSPTDSLNDTYRSMEDRLELAIGRVSQPPEGSIGIIATAHGQFICADIFDRPETLATYWTRLLRSYLLETTTFRTDTGGLFCPKELLLGLSKADFRPNDSPGLGIDVRFENHAVFGASLVHENSAVHTSVFPKHSHLGSSDIESPSRRARRRHV